MADILINLDEPVFSPSLDMSLLEMVKSGAFVWADGATCVTQECDGELIWWPAPTDEVKAARKNAQPETGLMPLVGFGSQVNSYHYSVDEQEFVAKDWQTAVVTFEQFTNLGSQG